MRLTSRTSYGVAALYDLAFHCDGRAAQAREIAARQGVPLRYLEQILQDLRRARLVEARRGPRGGYTLARAAADIPLAEAIEALDGPLAALFAPDGGDATGDRDQDSRTARDRKRGGPGDGAGSDVPALFWQDMGARVAEVFAGVTLGDLVARAEALGVVRAGPAPQMYFI